MPDDVDGRVLFGVAIRQTQQLFGRGVSDLGDIVMTAQRPSRSRPRRPQREL